MENNTNKNFLFFNCKSEFENKNCKEKTLIYFSYIETDSKLNILKKDNIYLKNNFNNIDFELYNEFTISEYLLTGCGIEIDDFLIELQKIFNKDNIIFISQFDSALNLYNFLQKYDIGFDLSKPYYDLSYINQKEKNSIKIKEELYNQGNSIEDLENLYNISLFKNNIKKINLYDYIDDIKSSVETFLKAIYNKKRGTNIVIIRKKINTLLNRKYFVCEIKQGLDKYKNFFNIICNSYDEKGFINNTFNKTLKLSNTTMTYNFDKTEDINLDLTNKEDLMNGFNNFISEKDLLFINNEFIPDDYYNFFNMLGIKVEKDNFLSLSDLDLFYSKNLSEQDYQIYKYQHLINTKRTIIPEYEVRYKGTASLEKINRIYRNDLIYLGSRLNIMQTHSKGKFTQDSRMYNLLLEIFGSPHHRSFEEIEDIKIELNKNLDKFLKVANDLKSEIDTALVDMFEDLFIKDKPLTLQEYILKEGISNSVGNLKYSTLMRHLRKPYYAKKFKDFLPENF